MQSKNSFVAGLFVVALCTLTVGGIDLYGNIDIRLHSHQATMEMADPDQKAVPFSDVLSVRTMDVKYVSSAGDVLVPRKAIPVEIESRLLAGEKIPITYLTNNHQRILYENHQLPNPWIWLGIGLVSLAIAIYALRLYKRERME